MTEFLAFRSWRSRLATPSLPLLAVLAVGWCVLLLAGRIALTRDAQYAFLVWNLFLAVLPVLIAGTLTGEQRAWKFWSIAALWLLFFPNAPYVLTDFVHLSRKARPEIPLWFDIGLLANFGIVALLFGLFSLRQMHRRLEQRIGPLGAVLLVSGSALLAGFGVYLGRFLRWNSWDIATRPLTLLADVADRFIHPLEHPRTWTFTALYGGTLLLLYWVAYFGIRAERHREP